ncbi:MAG: MoaD/ThiS family protein [Bacteroidales bacterium]|jgi:molybdopterin converting factor small subunit|nr:MoaD/ThiS family protein [Bacteroidales bacterium]
MSVKVLFFGVLGDRAGCTERIVHDVPDTDALEVMVAEEIKGLEGYSYLISVNRETICGNTLLKDGDEVAFLPPFAGG